MMLPRPPSRRGSIAITVEVVSAQPLHFAAGSSVARQRWARRRSRSPKTDQSEERVSRLNAVSTSFGEASQSAGTMTFTAMSSVAGFFRIASRA